MRGGPFGQRASKSADEARREERARIAAMPALARAELALRLGRRMKALRDLSRGP